MNFGDYVYSLASAMLRERQRERIYIIYLYNGLSWKVKNRGDRISCCYPGIQNTRGWREERCILVALLRDTSPS